MTIYLLDDAKGRVQELIAGTSPGPGARFRDVVASGRAHREILRAGPQPFGGRPHRHVGRRGAGGLGLTLFGSTTQHVVRAASCPV